MALSRHIAGLDLKLFIAALDKLEQFQMYGDGAVDDWLPDDMYCMLLTFIMERYVAFLSESGCRGEIVIESRGRKEDAKVQYWYSCVLNNGTQYYQNWTFQKGLPPTLEFRQKKDNVTGLQISDWIASPFARIVERKTPDQRNEWELYKPKIWLGKGAPAPGQVGFKTFPQNTGRDLLNMPLKSPQGSFEP